MMTKEAGKILREERLSVCVDVLLDMNRGEEPDLPQPNIRRLAQIMVERFNTSDYVDELEDGERSWRLTETYVLNNIQDISSKLAEREKPFGYYREWGDFRGLWKFMTKKEYKIFLRRNRSDVRTRTNTYNQKLDESKWDVELPHIAEVPLLN